MAAIWSPCDPPLVDYDQVAEAAEEDFRGDVQARIDALRPIDLADIVLSDDATIPVDHAARRMLGSAIRAALAARTYSSATLTDDERTLVAYVRETVEAEVRNG